MVKNFFLRKETRKCDFSKCIQFLIFCCFLSFFLACTDSIPDKFSNSNDPFNIYPDYKDVYVPVNVAPLNFKIDGKDDKTVCRVSVEGVDPLIVSGKNGEVRFPLSKWKNFLSSAVQGKDSALVSVDVWYKERERWKKFPPFEITVVNDSIDRYATCRLIEPSYTLTGEIGLFEFDIETGKVKQFVGVGKFDTDYNYIGHKCMNCHTSQVGHPKNKVFHHRSNNGGMVVTYNGETKIVDTKVGDMPASAVYERWHPSLPLIVFSDNVVRQAFPSLGYCKIEVFDYYSDLLLYDVEKNTVEYVLKTRDTMETYPTWSPDGKYLYYCQTDSLGIGQENPYEGRLYDLYRIPFNLETRTFGQPEAVYQPSAIQHSVAKPSVSADGRYVAMTQSSFGAYHYFHYDADVVVYDLQDSLVLDVDVVNSNRPEGYAQWSSTGRWLMVSSRRDDGNYARLYFSYFDRNGKAHKPFQLPHEDPLYDLYLLKSYNCPDICREPVVYTQQSVSKMLQKGEHQKAEYKGTLDQMLIDAYSGASTMVQEDETEEENGEDESVKEEETPQKE